MPLHIDQPPYIAYLNIENREFLLSQFLRHWSADGTGVDMPVIGAANDGQLT